MAEARYRGEVVKLDRGYPLVRLEDGELLRCEHATALVKGERRRAVIGDVVEDGGAPASRQGVIEATAPRAREFVRKDPTERAVPQVLATNFERVIVAQPVGEVNLRRLERELVLAFETGAEVTVVLTKADLADDAATRATVEAVQALAAPAADVLVVSEGRPGIGGGRARASGAGHHHGAHRALGGGEVQPGEHAGGRRGLKRRRQFARGMARAATPR